MEGVEDVEDYIIHTVEDLNKTIRNVDLKKRSIKLEDIKDPSIKTQQDTCKWLDKEIVRTGNRFYRLVQQLGFCNNLTPEIKEKLHDMIQGLIDTDKSIQSG